MNRRGKRLGWKPDEPDAWVVGDAHMRTGKLEGLAGRVARVHGGVRSRFLPQLLVEKRASIVEHVHDTRPFDLAWRDLASAKRTLWAAQEIVMAELARLRLGGEA